MGVIGNTDGQSQLVAHHGGKGGDALPRQVWRVLNAARHEVSTRSADTHGANRFVAAIGHHHLDNFLAKRRNKRIGIRIVHRAKVILSNHITADINNSVGRAFNTDIHTYDS